MKGRRGRGEGSIQKRPDGKWRATISMGVGPDGKRKRRDVYGKTKADVQKKLRQAQTANDAGRLITPQTVRHPPPLDRRLPAQQDAMSLDWPRNSRVMIETHRVAHFNEVLRVRDRGCRANS